MATGDQSDFQRRLRAALPSSWFPVTGTTDATSQTPILTAILTGFASSWASLYANLQFVAAQARIATASGVWLDVMALDYFGRTLRRRLSETDTAFSLRMRLSLLRPAGTRPALIANLTTLTGRTPAVFEPANPMDAGGWGTTGMTAGTGFGYGVAGGWGSLALPFQFFLTAYRPISGGVANVFGYYTGSGWAGGGYGVGAIEYANLAMVQGAVTDRDIFDAINAVRPVGTIAWTRITN